MGRAVRRNVSIEVRCTEEERALWRELAKPFSLSEFVRQLMLREQTRREDADDTAPRARVQA